MYAVCFGVLVTALMTVTAQTLFRSAIYLVFTLFGVALIYFFLHADFIAAVQILIYVGAIMTLVIFAVMLTSRIGDPSISQMNKQKWGALFSVILIGTFTISIIKKFAWNVSETPKSISALELGKALMSQYVFPFELISLVLLVALVGAIVISRNE